MNLRKQFLFAIKWSISCPNRKSGWSAPYIYPLSRNTIKHQNVLQNSWYGTHVWDSTLRTKVRRKHSRSIFSFLLDGTQYRILCGPRIRHDSLLTWDASACVCVVCVCVQEKTGFFCVAFVRVEDASFVRSLLFRCKAVQESPLTWVASVCVCETRKYHAS